MTTLQNLQRKLHEFETTGDVVADSKYLVGLQESFRKEKEKESKKFQAQIKLWASYVLQILGVLLICYAYSGYYVLIFILTILQGVFFLALRTPYKKILED